MVCPTCNTEVDDSSGLCPNCGSPLPNKQAATAPVVSRNGAKFITIAAIVCVSLVVIAPIVYTAYSNRNQPDIAPASNADQPDSAVEAIPETPQPQQPSKPSYGQWLQNAMDRGEPTDMFGTRDNEVTPSNAENTTSSCPDNSGQKCVSAGGAWYKVANTQQGFLDYRLWSVDQHSLLEINCNRRLEGTLVVVTNPIMLGDITIYDDNATGGNTLVKSNYANEMQTETEVGEWAAWKRKSGPGTMLTNKDALYSSKFAYKISRADTYYLLTLKRDAVPSGFNDPIVFDTRGLGLQRFDNDCGFSTEEGASSSNTTPIPDGQTAREADVKALLTKWTSSTANKDLPQQLDCYAPQMDRFFGGKNVSRDLLEEKKSKTFAATAEIKKFEISNLKISSNTPDEKIVTFDKTWDSTLVSGKQYNGSALERLKLVLINGSWKIKSEEELKVYYLNR
ncbi:MAG TPA: zinc ribbon domain-containing protein [Acidobacteriaceae bacterium]